MFGLQVDNARDFITLGGLHQVVKPSLLDSSDPEIAAKTAILLGSAAQSNPSAQESIIDADLLPLIMKLFSRPESATCCDELRRRAIYALSCLGKERSMSSWGKMRKDYETI